MKATWGIAAALLLGATAAMDTSAKGWGAKGKHGKHREHRGSWTEQLGLSEDQLVQVQTLKEDLRAQRQALGDQYRTDFAAILTDEQRETLAAIENPLGLSEDQAEQIQALKEQDLTKAEFRTSFAAILTDEQREALEHRRANRPNQPDLGLSADQKEQIQALKEQDLTKAEFRTSFAAILTDEQREALEHRRANRPNQPDLGLSADQKEQIQALKEQDLTKAEFRTSFEAILTDEQREALAAIENPLGLTEDQAEQVQALKEDLREQKQALRDQYRTGFEAILTAEQLATLEQIKADRGSQEAAETTKTAAAGKATAVEQTSWGRVKNSFGQ